MRKAVVAVVLAGLASSAVMLRPGEVHAQAAPQGVRIDASPQGAIGTGLLGAEAVIMIEGLAGVRNRWVLLGTGVLGAAGGAVGGFFIDKAIDDANGPSEVSTALLVAGLGLVIPTAIVFVNATMYRPDDSTIQEDNAPAAVPLEEGGAGAPRGVNNGQSRRGRHSPVPFALLNYVPGRFELGLPMVSMARSYSFHESLQYGLTPQTEWRMPLLRAEF